ncbi:MAG: cbb3-type cytochrome c oxidase subunit 3 [Burkholderiales bacterium]|nr:cbb3-type cytochrome c oxidase subunit 3 [Burkholderiales bacterium]
MNFTLLSSVFTVVSLIVFVGILWWAYSKENRARFEALGHLPLDEESSEIGGVQTMQIEKTGK